MVRRRPPKNSRTRLKSLLKRTKNTATVSLLRAQNSDTIFEPILDQFALVDANKSESRFEAQLPGIGAISKKVTYYTHAAGDILKDVVKLSQHPAFPPFHGVRVGEEGSF